jgi:hypothetical protein
VDAREELGLEVGSDVDCGSIEPRSDRAKRVQSPKRVPFFLELSSRDPPSLDPRRRRLEPGSRGVFGWILRGDPDITHAVFQRMGTRRAPCARSDTNQNKSRGSLPINRLMDQGKLTNNDL